jgi:hypothetical protein
VGNPTDPLTPTRVFAARSGNGGMTWSLPKQISPADLPEHSWPRTAVDPNDDTVYVTWWNNGDVEIVRGVPTSDGDVTWSNPVTVFQAADPAHGASKGPGPAVAVDASGTVGVLWYDMRNDTATTPARSDVWFAYSQDHGDTWMEIPLANFCFCLTPPVESGSFYPLGDYISLAPLSDGFGAAFVESLCIAAPPSCQSGNKTDVFYSHITRAPTAVRLVSFTSTASGRTIVLRWRTAAEPELLGFDVYRSGRKLNRTLIAARGSGVAGASYRVVDRSARGGVTSTYHLQAVRADGTRGWVGKATTKR